MICLNTEFEKYIDSETAEFIEKIEFDHIQEAISCAVGIDEYEHDLKMAVRVGVPTKVLSYICYYYWRKIIAEKHNFDEWERNRADDIDAEKARIAHELYDTNNGSD